MNREERIDVKLDAMLNRTKNAGFTNPTADYFEHFADGLPLQETKVKKPTVFRQLKENWFQISSFAVAALLILALWVFVFDANIKNVSENSFTVDELMALNDFQNYNEDLIYGEMASVSNDQNSNDDEVDALLDLGPVSIDEIMELSSKEDLK